MPILIPAAVNYPSPLIGVPSVMEDEPVEGRHQISMEYLWGSMGGPSKCIAVNFQNNNSFRQISSLKVDNSLNGSTVDFIFPDTGETITIPAFTPLAVVPVLSNATSFFVVCPTASAQDITRCLVLNYPARFSAYTGPPQNLVTFQWSAIWPPGAPTITQLIPAGTYGTLQNMAAFQAIYNNFATFPYWGDQDIYDGEGNFIITARKTQGNGAGPGAAPFPFNGGVKFHNGLIMRLTPQTNYTGTLRYDGIGQYSTP